MSHTRIKYVKQRPAEALRIVRHERQQLHTNFNCPQISRFAQRNRLLYVLMHLNVVVTWGEGEGEGVRE